MFFTKVGIAIAWIAFVLGALRIGSGLIVAFGFENMEAASRRYLGTANSGEAIDRGIEVIGYAIVFGILAEISRAVHKQPPKS